MKGKKVVYLMVALALPALVFIFLKFFGKNQFEVEPLFQEGVTGIPADCPEPDTGKPYRIPENILQELQWRPSDSLTLFYIGLSGQHSSPFSRIGKNVNLGEIRLLNLYPFSPLSDSSALPDQLIYLPEERLVHWVKCFIFLKEPNDLILVDHHRRIRGYYASQNRDEVDRLITEVAIILKHY
jgi:hypothetical protein